MGQLAKLALEDGTIFTGAAFGAVGEVDGEVCFNTSMTGYQEILTDPSYRGQIVTMTYPEIGNYGVNVEDVESHKPHLAGFIVRERSRRASNFRADGELHEYLARHGIVGMEGIDTRTLVRRIRTQGAMKSVLSTTDLDDAVWSPRRRPAPDWSAAIWCARYSRRRGMGRGAQPVDTTADRARLRSIRRLRAARTSWRWTTA